MGTHVLNLNLELLLGSLRGTFESHVLQEVCNTIVLGVLKNAASTNPNTNSGEFSRPFLSGYTDSIGKTSNLGVRDIQKVGRDTGVEPDTQCLQNNISL